MLDISAPAPASAQPVTPFSLVQVTLSKQEYIDLKWQANHYQDLWERARDRERELTATISSLKKKHKAEVAQLEAENKDLKSQLAHMKHLVFGRSTEKKNQSKQGKDKSAKNTTRQPSSRNRGQQRGAPGHGRRKYENLPVVDQDVDLPDNEKCCATCRLPFAPFPGCDHCDVIEVEVKPHKRRYHRKRYRKTCNCPTTSTIITAPSPARLVNKGTLGLSVWVDIIINKYAFSIPVNRQLQSYKQHGLDLAAGTVASGLQTLPALMEPVVECCRERVCSSDRMHADETRWLQWCDDSEGSEKHWLWVFVTVEAVYYSIKDSRAATVPESVIGESEGTLVCDRYSAYKKLAKDHPLIILAFCWAHVRRDFIDASRGDAKLEKWSVAWIDRIARLYYLNEQRLLVRDDPQQWQTRQRRVEKQVEQIVSQRDKELARPRLATRARKVLESLVNHWEGLCRFVDYPDIPMDNNIAEQTLRGPVVGRKNYYGSGSKWSAELAAGLFTVLVTLNLWKINQKRWLSGYLEACITNGRKPPKDLSQWIPWQMSESRLNELRLHDPPA